jgi:hypothetical protein
VRLLAVTTAARMPALMRDRLVLLVWLVWLAVLGACGNEIGDACFSSFDCSPDGDRVCVDASANLEGYCTIQGCDVSTCPDEAVCIRFFTGAFDNRACDATQTDDLACSDDELCALGGDDSTAALEGRCVARSSEVRFCMRTCGSDGDCRDGYECRDLARMKQNGGQPLLAPGVPLSQDVPKFCAKAP